MEALVSPTCGLLSPGRIGIIYTSLVRKTKQNNMAAPLRAFISFLSVLKALNFASSSASTAIINAQHTTQTEDGNPVVRALKQNRIGGEGGECQ